MRLSVGGLEEEIPLYAPVGGGHSIYMQVLRVSVVPYQ